MSVPLQVEVERLAEAEVEVERADRDVDVLVDGRRSASLRHDRCARWNCVPMSKSPATAASASDGSWNSSASSSLLPNTISLSLSLLLGRQVADRLVVVVDGRGDGRNVGSSGDRPLEHEVEVAAARGDRDLRVLADRRLHEQRGVDRC